jgi:hypothetical protein
VHDESFGALLAVSGHAEINGVQSGFLYLLNRIDCQQEGIAWSEFSYDGISAIKISNDGTAVAAIAYKESEGNLNEVLITFTEGAIDEY